MKTLTNLLAAFYFFSAMSCQGGDKPADRKNVTLRVNHYKAPCSGVDSQLCYLIQTDDQSEWEFLYEPIEGFDYQWGKVYELEVEKIKRKKVMSDQSPTYYKLIKVITSNDVKQDESFVLNLKDIDMTSIRKENDSTYSLLGKYPIRYGTEAMREELETILQSGANVTGVFQHADDHQAIVLLSIKN